LLSSRSRHTRFSRDWSSDVCSSDLLLSWLPIGDAHTFRDALARFVFRSRVTITVREDAWLHRDDDATPPAPWTTREHEGGIAVEIGRASCRERGEASGILVADDAVS